MNNEPTPDGQAARSPSPTESPQFADRDALIIEGRQLIENAELANKNQKVKWAITICIENGVTRGRTIIGLAARISFRSSDHVRVILAKGLAAGDWSKDEDGLYLLPAEIVAN